MCVKTSPFYFLNISVFLIYNILRKLDIVTPEQYIYLSVLTAIFPGEPGLAGFIGADDNDSDNWSTKTCNAAVESSPPTNQHPAFCRLDALPVAKGVARLKFKRRQPLFPSIPFPYLPLPSLPLLPVPSLPLLFPSPLPARGSGGALWAPPVGSGAKPHPLSNKHNIVNLLLMIIVHRQKVKRSQPNSTICARIAAVQWYSVRVLYVNWTYVCMHVSLSAQ